MAALHYKDDHNKAAYLEKSQGSEGYHQILDFLNGSSLRYALTHCPPIVYDSLVRQFWASATVRSLEDGFQELVATVDGNEIVVNESSIRTHLQLDDEGGLYVFTQQEILEGMAALGYPTDGTFTFYKNKFSPQWRYLVHTLIHCLSPKSGGWNQFPSSLASGLICLSDGRKYNFSRLILDGMIGNVGATKHKFLMYPRFIQMILGIQTTDPTPKAIGVFSSKLFANMKLKFEGDHMPLLAAMLPRENVGAGAAVPAGGAEEPDALTTLSSKLDRCMDNIGALETELNETKKTLGGAVLTLIGRVKHLEVQLKKSKRKVVLSDSEDEEGVHKDDLDI
ncbi:hypothetical protein Tco_1306930, partial [Tanacetum coccineum]